MQTPFDATPAGAAYETLIADVTTKFIAPYAKRAKVLLTIVRDMVPITDIVYGMGVWKFRCPANTMVTLRCLEDDSTYTVDAENYLTDPSKDPLNWPERYAVAFEELHDICSFLGGDGRINCMEDIT